MTLTISHKHADMNNHVKVSIASLSLARNSGTPFLNIRKPMTKLAFPEFVAASTD